MSQNEPKKFVKDAGRDEFLETLLRVRRDEPRRFEREVSAGMKKAVERYAAAKAEGGRKKAA